MTSPSSRPMRRASRAGGVLFLLSSNQQPQEHTAHNDSKRHIDPSFGAVGGPCVTGSGRCARCAEGGAARSRGQGKARRRGRSGLPWSPARGAGRERPGNGRYRPISSFTSRKQETAKSRSSRLWPALTCVRMRALPFWHHGIAEADHVHALFEHARGELPCHARVAEHHGTMDVRPPAR